MVELTKKLIKWENWFLSLYFFWLCFQEEHVWGLKEMRLQSWSCGSSYSFQSSTFFLQLSKPTEIHYTFWQYAGGQVSVQQHGTLVAPKYKHMDDSPTNQKRGFFSWRIDQGHFLESYSKAFQQIFTDMNIEIVYMLKSLLGIWVEELNINFGIKQIGTLSHLLKEHTV